MQTITKIGVAVLISGLPMVAGADQQSAGTKHQEAWTATLTAVDAQNGTIATKRWFFTKTFHASDHCAVVTVDKKNADLSDLRPGEEVTIRYQNVEGVLVADRIAERALHYRGTIQTVDPKTAIVTMERDAFDKTIPLHKTMRIAGDCKVILNDGRDGTVGDLKPGDRVAVIYELPGGAPVAYQIREQSATFVGTVEAIDLPARTLKAKDMLSEKKFDLADRCHIVTNGKPNASLKDLGLGQKYRFTYETVNGVNVVNYITPAQETSSAGTASTK